MIRIRNEEEKDYRAVEELTRKAFYNMYMPGCVEHYLVRIMRGHEDFIPELDFVAELDGKVIFQRRPYFCLFRRKRREMVHSSHNKQMDRIGLSVCSIRHSADA